MWFLTDKFGVAWVQIGFAHMEAKDRDHALGKAAQRAAIGFHVGRDTHIKVEPETGDPLE
jgi:hypothetical protein